VRLVSVAIQVTVITADIVARLLADGVVPEAVTSGWTCAHASDGPTGCRTTTSAFLKGLLGTCAACVAKAGGRSGGGGGGGGGGRAGGSGGGGGGGRGSAPKSGAPPPPLTVTAPVYDAPATVGGPAAPSCPECTRRAGTAPPCVARLFGIGTKRAGRSCRLVVAGGCWPKATDAVLADCGAGGDCRYKVSRGVSALWCCRAAETKLLRRWRNVFRCGSMARSKRSARGAVVMWES